jgi:prepilin signal peptidase PulO-like enzyme (type II secretory pathway)
MVLMIIVILALLGLVFGSFVNAFVWRLHEQELLLEKKKKPTKKQLGKFSILKGRSMCPDCQHELVAKDLVPVLSWLSLRGKCRYCAKPISWQYPVVEVVTSLLFILSYWYWPASITGLEVQHFVVWLGFIVMFMALAVYDLHWFLLPNRVVYPLIIVATVETVVLALYGHQISLVLQPALGALVIAGTFWVLFQVSNGGWIGGGDVKLAVVLGLLAGTPVKALLVLFFSSVIGTICSIPLLLKGKSAMKLKVPFGPFLLAATVVVVLFGTSFIDWYSQHLLGL